MGVVAAGAGHAVPACTGCGELLDLIHTATDRVRRRHDKVGEGIGHPPRWAVVEYLVPAPLYPANQRLLQEGENHEHMLAIYFMYGNFCRVHQTIRVTRALEAGLAHHVWSMDKLVSLLPAEEPKKRSPYKKK